MASYGARLINNKPSALEKDVSNNTSYGAPLTGTAQSNLSQDVTRRPIHVTGGGQKIGGGSSSGSPVNYGAPITNTPQPSSSLVSDVTHAPPHIRPVGIPVRQAAISRATPEPQNYSAVGIGLRDARPSNVTGFQAIRQANVAITAAEKVRSEFEQTPPQPRVVVGFLGRKEFERPFTRDELAKAKKMEVSPYVYRDTIAARERVVTGLTFGGKAAVTAITARQITTNVTPKAIPLIVLPKTITTLASKVSKSPIKSTVIYTGLQVAGATSTTVGKEFEAEQLRTNNIKTKEEAQTIIETSYGRIITKAYGQGTGSDIFGRPGASKETKPELYGEGIIQEAGRFFTPEGLVPIIDEKIAKESIREVLREKYGSANESDVTKVYGAIRNVGLFSFGGQISSEIGSEYGVSKLIAGSGKLKITRTTSIDDISKGLKTRIVLPQFAGGLVEGTTQTVNVETLSKRSPDLINVGIGGLGGGITSGLFGVAQSYAAPHRLSKIVTGAGYALDFPGEPLGDLFTSLGYKSVGRRRPVLSFNLPGESSQSTDRSIIKSSSKNIVRASTRGLDEFGLPIGNYTGGFSEARGESDSKSDNESKGSSDSSNNSKTSIYNFSPTESESRTNVTAFSESLSSAVNVSAITPAPGLPLFPAGRLGGEQKTGGRVSRLTYYDEFRAAFGNLLVAPTRVSKPDRPKKTSNRKSGTMSKKVLQNFLGFDFFKRGHKK